jgi:hypothetical protein
MPRVTNGSSQNSEHAAGDRRAIERDDRIRFLYLDPQRSDGTEVWGDGVNGPTPDQLDETPDKNGAQRYMKAVEWKSKRMFEWLKKLAEEVVEDSSDVQLKQHLQEGKLVFFVKLPDGYRLYEDITKPVSLLVRPVLNGLLTLF